jgi:peptide/nickel transport system substrate-binding protein
VGRSSLRLVIVAILLVVGISALSFVSPLSAQQHGGELVVAADVWPTSFDPVLSFGEQDNHYIHQLYDTLIVLKPDMTLQPGLATAWEFENPTTFVLKLRQGVRFHDGTPFDAEAVRFHFDRMMRHPGSVRKLDVERIKSVEVIDSYTVRVNLTAPDGGLTLRLTDRAGMIPSPTAVRRLGEGFVNAPVGTGPFKFHSLMVSNFARFVRNYSYWDRGFPYLDSVVFRVIATEPVMTQSFETGDVDFLYSVPLADVARIRRNSSAVYYGSPGSGTFMLNFNLRVAPMNNRLVRQALNHAIDKRAIVNSVLFGEAVPAVGPFSPTRSYAFDANQKGYPFDPARARQLLSQAGYPNGFDIALNYINRTTDTRLGEAIQGFWGDIGVRLTLSPKEIGAYLNEIQKNPQAAPSLRAWQTGSIDPDYDLARGFASAAAGGFWHGTGYADPTTDAMIRQIRATRTENERRLLYAQITKKVVDEAVGIYLYHPNFRMAHRSRVRGFVPMPDWSIRLKGVREE